MPYMKVMQAYNVELPIQAPIAPPPYLTRARFLSHSFADLAAPPHIFKTEESSHKTPLERHEEQIETILNHLDKLPLEHIEEIEDKIRGHGNDRAAIEKLVADSVATALEAQAPNMENADNTNRNTKPREAHEARKCSYKEFMSSQPFNFKVKIASDTLTEEALSSSNSFAQPTRIKEAYKITCFHKRKFDDRKTFTNNNYHNNRNNNNHKNDHHQQQNRRQETVRAYAATPTENHGYVGNFPLCRRCILYHTGPCTIKCHTCNNVGQQTKNYRNKGPATRSNLLPVSVTCHTCKEKGHYKSQCRKANNNTQGRAYLPRDKNAHQDPNVVTCTFLLNQHLARVLFDSRAVKSFISISLASMLNIPPITIDTIYDIEMVDGNLYHAKILCDEKVVHIPIDSETLIIRAKLVARACYRLAPSEMQELSDQLQELADREHSNHLRITLELLKKEKWYAKFSKCDLWINIVQFLRHVIDSQGIHVDPTKIEVVMNWASPTTPTEEVMEVFFLGSKGDDGGGKVLGCWQVGDKLNGGSCLQALSDLNYLFGGLIDYLWSWMKCAELDSCLIKSLKLPKSSNQLRFLIEQVPSGRTSNALSIHCRFSALMFSSLIALAWTSWICDGNFG
nr:hypothetical protein [Tanacetum cinerariifolium]